MSESTKQMNYTELAASIVSAYVSKNTVDANDLPGLIRQVHSALNDAGSAPALAEAVAPVPEAAKPAVNPKKSILHDYLICLEDGMKFKSLKRHLRSKYGLSPEDYKEKWGLPADYPMVAPAYSQSRSALAKNMELGRKRGTKLAVAKD
jgi:predicted transcriptional regulator